MICILVVVSNMFDFHPEFGEDSHFDYVFLFKWVETTNQVYIFVLNIDYTYLQYKQNREASPNSQWIWNWALTIPELFFVGVLYVRVLGGAFFLWYVAILMYSDAPYVKWLIGFLFSKISERDISQQGIRYVELVTDESACPTKKYFIWQSENSLILLWNAPNIYSSQKEMQSEKHLELIINKIDLWSI